MNRDVYGEALSDFFLQKDTLPLLLHASYGDTEEMPLDIFFREEEDFPELEQIALSLCDGKVLDVGAGVGGHSLYLQERGFVVDALEISQIACNIMRQRGVQHVVCADFFAYTGSRYDTLLFLMNGIGIAGGLDGFRSLLEHSEMLLSENGQLLFDSSDIAYLYRDYDIAKPKGYYGEIGYRYEYNGNQGSLFKWLYIDQRTLIKIGHEMGWVVQVLYEDENDQYLVRMEVRK